MSSTAVREKPKFMPGEYLRALVRKHRAPGEEGASVGSHDVPPFAPTSAFVIGDEVFECEYSATMVED